MGWLAGLGIVLVVVGCSAPATPRPAPSRTSTAPASAAPPTTTVTSIDDFAPMCTGVGQRFGGSPPYQGNGPHPVVLFLNGADEAAYASDGAPSGAGHLVGADVIQLVACARPDPAGPQTTLRTCHYQGGQTSTLLRVHWRFDVYEARTGRQVTAVPVDGAPDDTCPPVMEFSDGEAPGAGVYAPPTGDEFALLDSLVTGPVH